MPIRSGSDAGIARDYGHRVRPAGRLTGRSRCLRLPSGFHVAGRIVDIPRLDLEQLVGNRQEVERAPVIIGHLDQRGTVVETDRSTDRVGGLLPDAFAHRDDIACLAVAIALSLGSWLPGFQTLTANSTAR